MTELAEFASGGEDAAFEGADGLVVGGGGGVEVLAELVQVIDDRRIGECTDRATYFGRNVGMAHGEAADIRLEIAREQFGGKFPLHVVSAERGDGLPELKKALYDALGVIRIYTKQPGKPADMASPFTCPVGSTVVELAALVHRDFAEGLKSARVWGSAQFDGQTVKRDHVLRDKDVVELHM